MANISLRGVKTHNLKIDSLDLPRNELIAVGGVSGSGKSSLVRDVIYASIQREFLATLGSFASRNMPRLQRPNVDMVRGLSYGLHISQSPMHRNPRSTVGTITDIYSYVRLMFARLGEPVHDAACFSFNNAQGACEVCKGLGERRVPTPKKLIDFDLSLADGAIRHRAWKVGGRLWNIVRASEFFDIDKPIRSFSDRELNLLLYGEAQTITNEQPGYVQNFRYEGIISRLEKRAADKRDLTAITYDGEFFEIGLCQACGGSRLNARARDVRIGSYGIADLLTCDISELPAILEDIRGHYDSAADLIDLLMSMVDALCSLSLGYLTLLRGSDTLSGGEAQRVKLARVLSGTFCETIYALDEPSIGLHPKNVEQLIDLFQRMVGMLNTVIVIEHDAALISAADYIVELGPGAGHRGGEVVFSGSKEELWRSNTTLARALKPRRLSESMTKPRPDNKLLSIRVPNRNNLKVNEVRFMSGALNSICGVSGSGKSSLVSVIAEQWPDVVVVDQAPVGSNPRSVVASYIKVLDRMREIFANETGHKPSEFSFNGPGACEKCSGLGYIRLDMHFLGDVEWVCERCNGSRYEARISALKVGGRSIADILALSVADTDNVFDDEKINRGFQLLHMVGLEYLTLGQSLKTLSGGERQRLKIIRQLGKSGAVIVMDEPSRGLHANDVEKLASVLRHLCNQGNTVIIVEHDMQLVAMSDWCVELGPGGGKNGGRLIAEGRPESLLSNEHSPSAPFLAPYLGGHRVT